MGLVLEWPNHMLDLDKRTHIMGILNITPDSFFDGGWFLEREKAIEHGVSMAREGADIIDIGGESTRPYSKAISSAEEMDRVIPVIESLSKEVSVPISIDTTKVEVAKEALKVGASIINDVSALRFDADMPSVAAEAAVPVVLMHMKGRPENMQDAPVYQDLITDILGFLRNAVEGAVSAGIRKENIIVDPGIGFGKTFNDNLRIINELDKFQVLGRPILLGTSNKAFIGHILSKEGEDRDTGTMATVSAGALNGAHILRVHNVRRAVETVTMIDAIKRGQMSA